MTFTEEQHRVLEIVAISSGLLGSLGSLVLIVSYLAFRKKLSKGQSSVVWMSIADLINNVGFGIQYWSDHKVICYIEAILITVFELAAILWNVNIATYIVATILFPRNKPITTKKQWLLAHWWVPVFHAVAWGIPIILCGVALSQHWLGQADPWCWVAESIENPLLIQLFIFYLWLWGSIGYIVCCYAIVMAKVIYLYLTLRSKDRRQAKAEAKHIFISAGKLFLYPLVLMVSYIPATISRIVQFSSQKKFFALALMHSISVHLLGISNCIVFFLTQNILKHYLTCIQGIFRSRSRQPLQESSDIHHDDDDETIHVDDHFIVDDSIDVRDNIQNNLDAIDIHSTEDSEDDEYANQLPNMHYKDGPMKPML